MRITIETIKVSDGKQVPVKVGGKTKINVIIKTSIDVMFDQIKKRYKFIQTNITNFNRIIIITDNDNKIVYKRYFIDPSTGYGKGRKIEKVDNSIEYIDLRD